MAAEFAKDEVQPLATSSGTPAPEMQKPPEPAKEALAGPAETWDRGEDPMFAFHPDLPSGKKPVVKKAAASKAAPSRRYYPIEPKEEKPKPKAKSEWPAKKSKKKLPPVDPNRKSKYLPLHVDTSILIPSVLLATGAKKAVAVIEAGEATEAGEASEASEAVKLEVAAYVPTFSFTSFTPMKTAPATTAPATKAPATKAPATKAPATTLNPSRDIPTTIFSFPIMTESTPKPAPAGKAEVLNLKAAEEPVKEPQALVKAQEEPVKEPLALVKAPEEPVAKLAEYVEKPDEDGEYIEVRYGPQEEPKERIEVPPPGQRKSK